MAHVSPEQLAGHALGLADELTAEQTAHLGSCPECTAELAGLTRVADLGRERDTARTPLAPSTDVWTRILAEVTTTRGPGSADIGPHASAPRAILDPARSRAAGHGVPDGERTPVTAVPRRAVAGHREAGRSSSRRRRFVVLAAAVGLVAGAGGALGIVRGVQPDPVDDVTVVARTTLAPLPGQTGSGSAELLRTPGGAELRVQVDAAPDADHFHELWLINTDGEKMYALGTLPASGRGSYPVPPALAERLQGYTIVDVSIEPYDGKTAHSQVSLVRGTLP